MLQKYPQKQEKAEERKLVLFLLVGGTKLHGEKCCLSEGLGSSNFPAEEMIITMCRLTSKPQGEPQKETHRSCPTVGHE